jgi:hypothetical protein
MIGLSCDGDTDLPIEIRQQGAVNEAAHTYATVLFSIFEQSSCLAYCKDLYWLWWC